jgi:large subunit ribosomal protein L18
MLKKTTTREARLRRHRRVRAKVRGVTERPRLNVFRSLSHIYAQVIDDETGTTLAAASSMEPELQTAAVGKTKVATAKLVGSTVAKRAAERGVTKVVFDRGGYMYHGRVKALAEAARGEGLQF